MFLLVTMAPAVPTIATTTGPQVNDTGQYISSTIPKWVNQLTGAPPVYAPTNVYNEDGDIIEQDYEVHMVGPVMQQILPSGMPKTPVFAYQGLAKNPVTGKLIGVVTNSPACSFEATRGIPSKVKWVNDITSPSMYAVDPTLMIANANYTMGNMAMPPSPPYPPYPPGFPDAQFPVPTVPHLHGAEASSYYDGGPNSWFTANGVHGPWYSTYETTDANAAVYYYPNGQLPATLWYHDHAMGMTRINVLSGLAGFYLLKEKGDPIAKLLPSGKYDVPLAIQDRIFNADGSFWFPSEGINPDIHPYWNPEYFGDTIMVNGLVWPNMNVDRAAYMLRLLDGSNARFYNLSFSNGMPFTVVGSDSGYVKSPVSMNKLLIAPGERYVIVVDFSKYAPGTKIKMLNDAIAPYPSGDPADPNTTGQIMQFTVGKASGPKVQALPSLLNPTLAGSWPSIGEQPSVVRIKTLYEVEGPNGPLMVTVNGQDWMAPVSELPVVGATEEWDIVDTTMDAHPMHWHLISFQLVYRQYIDIMNYTMDWIALNGNITPPYLYTPLELDWHAYAIGDPIYPGPEEQAWKDTVKNYPGQVAVFKMRFTPNDGSASFPFDPTEGPGYVWHCHIIDHEDNDMMRPYIVVNE